MIKLNGHSGCKVYLSDDSFVRKISSSISYNNRLISQMNKQKKFNSTIIKTPKILNYGFTKEGLFYFDMEYIRGINLCEFFIKNSTNDCKNIIETIIKRDKKYKINIEDKIKNKLDTLPIDKSDYKMILDCNWEVDFGYCHGDLTFENIIISEKNIYLIDFLDSFVNSPIIDESKILQDSFCFWSFSNFYHIPKIKLEKITEIFNTKQHFCMLFVHLLRIIPYSNEKKKEDVLCMMNQVKKKISQF